MHGQVARSCTIPGRMRTLALVVVLGVTWVLTPVASVRTVLLGRSWQGRPIDAIEVGNRQGTPVVVVGCVHGNETGGIAIARALERLSPHDLDLWIVPDLNPDGVAAGSRKNAHGVDLNRNFPWRWRPLSGVYESGPRPLSEREARIAHALILRVRPHLTIWFHQHLDLVWASGGHRRIEKVFSRVSGLPYHPLPQLAGSAISWQNNTPPGTTAFAAGPPQANPGPRRLHVMCARSLRPRTRPEDRVTLDVRILTACPLDRGPRLFCRALGVRLVARGGACRGSWGRWWSRSWGRPRPSGRCRGRRWLLTRRRWRASTCSRSGEGL